MRQAKAQNVVCDFLIDSMVSTKFRILLYWIYALLMYISIETENVFTWSCSLSNLLCCYALHFFINFFIYLDPFSSKTFSALLLCFYIFFGPVLSCITLTLHFSHFFLVVKFHQLLLSLISFQAPYLVFDYSRLLIISDLIPIFDIFIFMDLYIQIILLVYL